MHPLNCAWTETPGSHCPSPWLLPASPPVISVRNLNHHEALVSCTPYLPRSTSCPTSTPCNQAAPAAPLCMWLPPLAWTRKTASPKGMPLPK